jgi:L-fuconate dehydratase
VGLDLDWITEDGARFWRHITGDSQLRWIGPDKGAMHLATGAVVNAVWDLYAKAEGKPVWRLVADMSPEQIVSLIDFRYLTDALTPAEALSILRRGGAGKQARLARIEEGGYPCYTTSAGWLGYSDEELRRRCKQAVDDGFSHIKLKVGANLKDDIRRLTIAREVIGPDRHLMIDANQVWEVNQAVEWINTLAFANRRVPMTSRGIARFAKPYDRYGSPPARCARTEFFSSNSSPTGPSMLYKSMPAG